MLPTLLTTAGLLGLAVSLVGLARCRSRQRARQAAAERRARDVFTLHPGTVALWDAEAAARGEDPFRGYLLPSGRIVRRRYWRSLEGVRAQR